MWGQRENNLANRNKGIKTKQAETVWGGTYRRLGSAGRGQGRGWEDQPEAILHCQQCCETPEPRRLYPLAEHPQECDLSLLRDILSSTCWDDLILKLLNSVWPDMGVSMAPINRVPVCSNLLFLKLVNDAHKEGQQQIISVPNEALCILEKPYLTLAAQFFVHEDMICN